MLGHVGVKVTSWFWNEKNNGRKVKKIKMNAQGKTCDDSMSVNSWYDDGMKNFCLHLYGILK